MPVDVPPVPPAEPPPGVDMQLLARRLGALLFVVVFLLDVLGQPELLLAVSRLCGL